MSEWHQGFRKQIEYCTYCPKMCRFSCPVAKIECSETVTPTAKGVILKLARDGAIPFDSEVGELVYACNGCLITRTYCEHDIDVFPPLEAARIEAVKRRVAPDSVWTYLEKWNKKGNPFDEDLAAVVREAAGGKCVRGKAPVVLFTGCVSPHYFPEQIKDLVRVMEAAGNEFTVFAEERLCCGYPLLSLGHKKEFLDQAGRVASALAGAELVVSPCPSCVHFLKNRYEKEFGIKTGAEVRHITEYAAENLEKMNLKSTANQPAIYHDPCYLGRYMGVYDEPRRLLEAALGSPPIEFFDSRDGAACCGGGGGLPVTRPDTAEGIARDKADAVPEYGTELIATACPTCQRMLGRAGRGKGVKAVDVISLLCTCM